MANSFILTKKGIIVGASILGAIVLALGANFVILPAINSISEINTQIEDAGFAKDDAETQLTQAKKDQTDYEAVKSLDSSLIGQFPDTGETQQLIETIQQGAINSGIPLTQLTSIGFTAVTLKTPEVSEAAAPPAEGAAPEAAAPPADAAAGETPVSPEVAQEVSTPAAAPTTSIGAGYGELELSINITGKADEIQRFLKFINSLERAVIIKSASINPEGEDGNVSLSFSAKTYVYAQIPDPTTMQQQPDATTETEETPAG